ncbi:hypothetical protein DERP_011287 [Dermatophagoides pteronyssinus]|uniref:Uncharacterized protein n=1 Tax=Dermatophagoides pteronyssinus TaxID=6956 RepID=A0ABQ8J7P1_DERPT|nr:hypothetical protein DERP_011287 [Dermatophagoides pteronyssinus]
MIVTLFQRFALSRSWSFESIVFAAFDDDDDDEWEFFSLLIILDEKFGRLLSSPLPISIEG